MMQNLLLTEGDIVKFQYTKLLKGQYVKLRPQTKDFLDISNPKAVLETTLRTYTCLTVGDSILINYNNKRQGFVLQIRLLPPPHLRSVPVRKDTQGLLYHSPRTTSHKAAASTRHCLFSKAPLTANVRPTVYITTCVIPQL